MQLPPAHALAAGDPSGLVPTMRKFRHKRILSRSLARQRFAVRAQWPARYGWRVRRERLLRVDRPLRLPRELEMQWTALHRLCPDRGSRTRLARLINRLVARVSQKTRQLVDYCAPVLLAITVPHRNDQHGDLRDSVGEELDLKQLASAITVMLPGVPQISAVHLSLWDVRPLPARSGVRLANVQVVQRPPQQTAYPRVRL